MRTDSSGAARHRRAVLRARVGLVAAVWLLAAPAWADPISVFFTGPSGYGVEESEALAFSADHGIPIVELQLDPTGSVFMDAQAHLDIVSQNLAEGSVSPFPPTSPDNTASSTWIVGNEYPDSIDAVFFTYLVFVTPEPYQGIAYDDESVGLGIDADDGWVFVHASDGGTDYYFPGVAIDLAPGEVSDGIGIHYQVTEPLQALSNRQYVLPGFQTAVDGFLVPEPASGALLAAGLALMAAARRRRA